MILAMVVLAVPGAGDGLPISLDGIGGQVATTALLLGLVFVFHRLAVARR